jgi:2-dehydro-3-deoxyphosphogluconate aldolase/(4S)-4-hydroxy-2-oxoglutarate aldolase
MDNETIMKTLESARIIPVIAIESAKDAVPLADALIAGGLPIAEITFRTAAALDVIKTLAAERPKLLVGAGTVLNVETLEKAKAAGAVFGVAPGLNEKVVKRAAELKMLFVPGVATPTEIESAMQLGCKILKFFPAGAFGGLKALSAVGGPYLHTGVRFVPTGGINADNLKEYLDTRCVFAVGGTWLATKEDIKKGDWDTIAAKCRQAVAIREEK